MRQHPIYYQMQSRGPSILHSHRSRPNNSYCKEAWPPPACKSTEEPLTYPTWVEHSSSKAPSLDSTLQATRLENFKYRLTAFFQPEPVKFHCLQQLLHLLIRASSGWKLKLPDQYLCWLAARWEGERGAEWVSDGTWPVEAKAGAPARNQA